MTTFTVTDKATVGQQIKMAMNQQGQTQKSVFEGTGIHASTLQKVLQDKSYDIAALKKLARHLGITVHIYP